MNILSIICRYLLSFLLSTISNKKFLTRETNNFPQKSFEKLTTERFQRNITVDKNAQNEIVDLLPKNKILRLELVFEKEEERSDELESSLELADSWKRQGDELLYSMIPRPIAERLRNGQNTLDTCQSFEQVSVIFGEVQAGVDSILENHTVRKSRVIDSHTKL